MQKFLLFVVVLVILGGGYYFYAQKNRPAMAPTVENDEMMGKEDKEDEDDQTQTSESQGQPASSSSSSSSSSSTSESPPPSLPPQGGGMQTEGTFSGGEGDTMAPDVLVVQVDYSGAAFSPASVDIKLGDIVIFKNNSNVDFWPASAPHPSHTDYPEFDAKAAIAPGGKWQFKFEKVGQWRFHDHLNPGARGTVNVSAR